MRRLFLTRTVEDEVEEFLDISLTRSEWALVEHILSKSGVELTAETQEISIQDASSICENVFCFSIPERSIRCWIE
jgi:hypothetical protein